MTPRGGGGEEWGGGLGLGSGGMEGVVEEERGETVENREKVNEHETSELPTSLVRTVCASKKRPSTWKDEPQKCVTAFLLL